MISASGVLFLTPDKHALFLKRGESSDHPGEWGFPGGHAEDDETPDQTAVREVVEEIGFLPKGSRALLTRTVTKTPLPVTVPAASPPSLPTTAAVQPGAATAAPTPLDAAPALPPVRETCFTTFLQRVDAPFEPDADALKQEHVGYAWAPVDAPPEPLHPGCRIALSRVTMDELGVARAIVSGDLTSPQRYENVTLFDIRITGTDTAYRKKLDEYSYRPPEIFLSPDFLARCNGLPVIWEHPEKSTLDSKEYRERNVGTVFLPYLSDGVRHPPDEVWAVAKIFDDEAAGLMSEDQLSTSPAVVFRDPDVNTKLTLDNGSTLLIEGKPSLLDHIAICERGVWDKGDEPSGVVRGDSDMAEEEKTEVKDDAAAGVQVDKLLEDINCKLDALGKRMDSYDEEDKKDDGETEGEDFMKKDARRRKDDDDDEEGEEEVRRDRKRKDGEMPENFKKDAKRRRDREEEDDDEDGPPSEAKKDKRKDSRADSDAVSPAVQRALDAIAARIPKQVADADYEAMASAQSRADSVYAALGKKAPRPLDGESLLGYRRRLAGELKTHSKVWKDVNLLVLADDALPIAETQIYADAETVARNPIDLGAAEMRSIVRRDDTGRNITEFVGKPGAWMSQFSGSRRRVAGIRTKSN